MTGRTARGERPALDERLVAEQDERRRLAELIHDGPVQHLAALAQIIEAAAADVRGGNAQRASELLERALTLVRETSGDLRVLVAGLEPDALSKEGFAAAVHRLGELMADQRGVVVETDVEAVEALGEAASIGLYQIVRESLDHALRRGPPTRVSVRLTPTATGGVELVVTDDGSGERRQAVIDALAERAATLNAELEVEQRDDEGTIVRVTVPPSSAHR